MSKKFLVMGFCVLAISSMIIFSGCNKSNATSVTKANDAMLSKTTEVMENIDIFNPCEINRIERIKDKIEETRKLNHEFAKSKKKLKHNNEVYKDIELHIIEIRRTLNNLYQIRKNDVANTHKKKPNHIDTNAMKLRHDRMEQRSQKRIEFMNGIITDLDTLNEKLCIALGKCPPKQNYNVTFMDEPTVDLPSTRPAPQFERPVTLPYYFTDFDRPVIRRLF